MKCLKLLVAAGALAVSAQAASAAVIYADTVLSSSSGGLSDGVATPGSRTDVDNALGAADGNFYSLGIGGDITLAFNGGQKFNSGTSTTYEITFGLVYQETADVDFLLGGVVQDSGSISNLQAATGGSKLTTNKAFDAIRLTDTSSKPPSQDGFDIDAISVKPIPLPAAGFLLLGGLAGFGALRRRRK